MAELNELPSGQTIGIASDGGIEFSSTTSGAGSKDVGLKRLSATRIIVTDGSATNTGDIYARFGDFGGYSGGEFQIKARIAGGSASLELGSGGSVNWYSGSVIGAGNIDATLKRAAANIIGLTNGDTAGAAFEFTEMTAPSAGASNTARLFCRDNGSGKSQLCVIFATGAIQVVATEP